nr:hypothetical protein [uncultured Bacteroides sp.]
MGAAALTAGIGAGASLLGGIGSTSMQNKSNKEIAQMNNAFNEKMLDKQMNYNKEMYQMQVGDQWEFYNDAKQNAWDLYGDQKDFQVDMWNKTNEYNSPEAQRQRLEAAGLNPYIMMNGGSAGVAGSVAGTAGSSPSAPSSPGAQGVNPPAASPYSADYSGLVQGLGHAIDTLMSAPERSVKNAEAANLRIEGKYKASKMLAEIYSMRSNARTTAERLQLDKLIASFDNDLKTAQLQETNERTGLVRAQTKLAVTENLMRTKELDFLPQVQRMQLAQSAADIAYRRSQKQLTDKQAAHEIEKLAETVARAGNVKQSTENMKTENMIQGQNYRFDNQTYKTRVKVIEEQLWNIMHDGDMMGASKVIGRVIRPLYE